MSRTSMADLITRVRFMVGDPVVAGTPPTSTFTDDEIQEALDHHRTDVLQARLDARSTWTTAGAGYLDYYSPKFFNLQGWEDSVVIEDGLWATVTPASEDLTVGHWRFTSSTLPNLYVTGNVFDLYGAAVEVLEAWQSKDRVAGDFDFSEDGQSFSRSQKGRGIAAQAQEYRRKALPAGPRFAGRES